MKLKKILIKRKFENYKLKQITEFFVTTGFQLLFKTDKLHKLLCNLNYQRDNLRKFQKIP